MPPLTLPQLTSAINTAVNPDGGAPLIKGSALNQLLHSVVESLAALTPGLEVLAVAPAGGSLGGGGFNTIPLGQPTVDVRPAGSPGGWDLPNAAYVAPVSGTYELLGRMRISDPDGPVGSSYCLAAGPANTDGEWVQWNTIYNVNGGYNRKGVQVARVLHLAAGQPVRLYAYLDGFSAGVGGELTIKLLRRDDTVAVL